MNRLSVRRRIQLAPTDQNRHSLRAGAAVALAFLLVAPLAGCSGGESDSSAGVVASATAAPEMAPDQGAADLAQGAPAAGSAAKGSDNTVGRSVITTISTTVEVEDVPAATARVIAATTTARGYVEQQYSTGTGQADSSSSIAVRIPGELVDQFLTTVADLGTVVSTERSAEDVTAQVADIDARLANARAGVKRLRELMDRATKVSDVVEIESALSERQAEAESLAAQQRALADQTSLATVTVVLIPQTESAPSGFLGGLQSGWRAFTASVSGMARLAGYVLPFAILGGLLIGLVFLIVHLTGRRDPNPKPVAQPQPGPAAQPQPGPAAQPQPGQWQDPAQPGAGTSPMSAPVPGATELAAPADQGQ